MKGILTLDQELRATRLAKGQKNATRPDRQPAPREDDRPWQPEIDRMQQTMREVLRAIAGLSGVELPGLPPGLQDDSVPQPRLDIKTLKDRFRHDLEGFSIKTTEELTKRAKEQTRAALDEAQNEVVGGRLDQVAAELREKLQSPAQIEKFVVPAVEKAAARLEESLSQKLDRLLAEHEKLVQGKLQGVMGSVQAQVNAQVAAELREKLQSPAQIERLVEPAAEKAAARLESSLCQKVEQQFAGQQQLVHDKLQGTLTSVQAQVSTQIAAELRDKLQAPAQIDGLLEPAVEKAAARLEGFLSQKIERLLAEHEKMVQDKLQGALSTVKARINTLEQSVQQIGELKTAPVAQTPAEQPMAKVEHLLAEQERLVQDKLQGALSAVQSRINTLEQSVQQIREVKANSAVQAPAEQPVAAAADNAAIKQESGLDSGFKGFLDQAFSRIECSFNNLLEIPKKELVQSTNAKLEGLREAIPNGSTDMLIRVQQALDNLDRLGTKNPPAAS
jgi:hypothetical protein